MSVVDLLNVRYVEGWHVCVKYEPVAVCGKLETGTPDFCRLRVDLD